MYIKKVLYLSNQIREILWNIIQKEIIPYEKQQNNLYREGYFLGEEVQTSLLKKVLKLD